MAAGDFAGSVTAFDYEAVAELFPPRIQNTNRQFAGYRRFDRAADALRFAIEEMPRKSLLGAYLEVAELRIRPPRNAAPLRERGVSSRPSRPGLARWPRARNARPSRSAVPSS
jgi:hypothetical protein